MPSTSAGFHPDDFGSAGGAEKRRSVKSGGMAGALVAQKVGRSFQQTNKSVMSGNRWYSEQLDYGNWVNILIGGLDFLYFSIVYGIIFPIN